MDRLHYKLGENGTQTFSLARDSMMANVINPYLGGAAFHQIFEIILHRIFILEEEYDLTDYKALDKINNDVKLRSNRVYAITWDDIPETP